MIADRRRRRARRRDVRRRRRGRRAADRRLVVPRHRADLRRPTATAASPSTGRSTRGAGSSRRATDDAALARRYAERAGDEVRTMPDGARGRVDRRRRRRHARHHRAVPAAPQPQPGADPGARSRRCCAPSSASTTIVWLPHGLALDDDTDGHVDNVAAFARPGTLLVQGCDDEAEDDWLRCNVNRRCAARRASTPAASRSRSSRSRCCRSPRSAASGWPCRTSTTTSATASSSCRCAATPPTPTWWRSSPSSTPAGRSIGLDVGADARLRRRRHPLHHPAGPQRRLTALPHLGRSVSRW